MSLNKNHYPNIILIVIDALRARNLGCYGGGSGASPNIDKLADGGIVFEKAYSSWNTTDQSLTTILTGRYPRTHGIIHHFNKITPEDLNNFKRLEIKLLAQILCQYGYKALAVDWMSRWFKSGFDYYGYKLKRNLIKKFYYNFITLPLLHIKYIVESTEILKIYAKKRKFSFLKMWGGFRDIFRTFMCCFELARIQNAAFVTGIAEELLERIKREKFFLFLHYWDTHSPYNCPKKFFKGKRKTLSSEEFFVSKYKGAVRYIDYQLGKLFAVLKEKRLMEKTLIIITSDHGDSLTEHKIYFDHHGLYEETIHVPLIFYYPKFFTEEKRIKGFVQHVDILPTICELLNIDYKEYNFDGDSLIPLINQDIEEIRPYVYSEESYVQRKVSLRTKKYKYIFAPDNIGMCSYCLQVHGGSEELYDLENDPEEIKNIVTQNKEMAEEMKAELMEVMRDLNTKKEKQLIFNEIVSLREGGKLSEPRLTYKRTDSKKDEQRKGGSMKQKRVTLELSEELIAEIEKRIKNTEFDSIKQYLTYIIGEVLQRSHEKVDFNSKEEKKIKKKLRSLGYID